MINNDDGTFLVIYSLLKIKIKQVYDKASTFENIFEIPWNM